MAPSNEAASVASSISKLSIDPKKGKPKKSAKKVVDSWEDEDVSSGSEEELSQNSADRGSKEGTAAPPPTPVSPNYNISQPFQSMNPGTLPAYDAGTSSRRPEKTDAVARRMIAGALGMKAPKQTEEQKAYDKALREKERKKREDERTADKKRQEEAERARKAIWED